MSVGILSWVVWNSGPSQGTVIAHVMAQGARVQIGPRTFRVRDTTSPVVCELPRGEYTLTVTRNHQVLDEQRFQVHGGQWVILSTIDPRGAGASEAAPGSLARARDLGAHAPSALSGACREVEDSGPPRRAVAVDLGG